MRLNMPVLYQLINLGSPQWLVCPEDLKNTGLILSMKEL